MMVTSQKNIFQWMDEHELHLCIALNKYTSYEVVRGFFAVISRLGNGIFWYSLMLVLPLFLSSCGEQQQSAWQLPVLSASSFINY